MGEVKCGSVEATSKRKNFKAPSEKYDVTEGYGIIIWILRDAVALYVSRNDEKTALLSKEPALPKLVLKFTGSSGRNISLVFLHPINIRSYSQTASAGDDAVFSDRCLPQKAFLISLTVQQVCVFVCVI